ncbi:MAG: lysophospholipase [Bacillota bacterium]
MSDESRLDLGEGHLTGTGGVDLFYRFWRPSAPRGVVVLVHGAGEHCGRFDHVARALAGRGLAVYGYDHRGLGRSGGRRGHLERFTDYIDDLSLVIAEARRLSPNLPLGLYGHSMGGAVVLAYGIQRPAGLSWVVATSPWVELAVKLPGWKKALGNWLSRVWPTLSMDAGVPPRYLAHPPEVGEAYVKDPYVTMKVSARWYTEMVSGAAGTLAVASGFTLPLLLLQAGDDRLVSANASRQFFDRAGSSDKTFRLYPGLYHELHNEPEGMQIVGEIADWLEPRLETMA